MTALFALLIIAYMMDREDVREGRSNPLPFQNVNR